MWKNNDINMIIEMWKAKADTKDIVKNHTYEEKESSTWNWWKTKNRLYSQTPARNPPKSQCFSANSTTFKTNADGTFSGRNCVTWKMSTRLCGLCSKLKSNPTFRKSKCSNLCMQCWTTSRVNAKQKTKGGTKTTTNFVLIALANKTANDNGMPWYTQSTHPCTIANAIAAKKRGRDFWTSLNRLPQIRHESFCKFSTLAFDDEPTTVVCSNLKKGRNERSKNKLCVQECDTSTRNLYSSRCLIFPATRWPKSSSAQSGWTRPTEHEQRLNNSPSLKQTEQRSEVIVTTSRDKWCEPSLVRQF